MFNVGDTAGAGHPLNRQANRFDASGHFNSFL
jgi:hypothetical protein